MSRFMKIIIKDYKLKILSELLIAIFFLNFTALCSGDILRVPLRHIYKNMQEKQKIMLLERIATGEVDCAETEAGKIIKEVVKLGTERPDVQRALTLYSVNKKRPITGLFKNYHLNGEPVDIIVDKDVEIKYGDSVSIHRVFNPNRKGMVIETHPDDGIIHMGMSMDSLSMHAIPLAKDFQKNGDVRRRNKIDFVTGINDEAGVKNWQIWKMNIPREILVTRDKNAIKRYIRAREAKENAALLQLSENHYNLDIKLPVKRGVYSDKNRLIAAQSVFEESRLEDQKKVNEFIRTHLCDYYFMVFPFSNHPQHRIVTRMFLEAIYRYNRTAEIYFWADEQEFKQHGLKANTYLLYELSYEKNKELKLFNANTSQDERAEKDRGDLEYYCKMSRRISEQAALEAKKEIKRRGLTHVRVDESQYGHSYADRFIKVHMKPKNQGGNNIETVRARECL